jgi:tripartite-type tricarboxylate transporter receptor subunit TctC
MHDKERAMKAIYAISLLPVLGLALAPEARSDTWPSKPVKVIVPFAAGSTTDIVPRVVFEQLSSQLKQSIVVENRAGAGGTTGSGAAAKAEPDGYTLLAHGSALTISPALYSNLSFDPGRDFAPVIPLGMAPNVLVVPPDRGWKSVSELVAAGKAKPGALTFCSVGVGSATQLSAERFRHSAGVDAVHVPFKGGAEAMTEVIAGRIDFFFGPVGLVLPHVQEGKLRALAVNGAKRSSVLPDVPTTKEAGIADAEYPIWFGLFLPAKAPSEIVQKLHGETFKALQSPTVRDKLSALGIDAMPMSPAEFRAHVQREIVNNAELVKATGLKAQ